MFLSLDSSQEFRNAGVIFESEKSDVDKLMLPAGSILNASSHYDKKTLRETCRADGKIIYIRELIFPKQIKPNNRVELVKSALKTELINTGISCGGAGLGWILLLVEAGGGSVTVGSTWAAMPLTLTATSASTFQCGVAGGRVINELNGNSEYNHWLDTSPTFSTLVLALDVIQMADVSKTLGANSLIAKFVQNKPFGTFKLLKMYKGMTRRNRKKLAQEILKFEYRELRASQKLLKEVLRGNKLLDDGRKAIKVYSQVQAQKLIRSMFYQSFVSAAALKGAATGIASVSTIYGSGQSIINKTKQSVNFVIGISHRE